MKVSSARKATFCEALVKGQTPETAAKAIGVDRRTIYRWRDADAEFSRAWAEARERKIEVVENTLYRMAVEKDLGAVIFFLKCHKPEVYNRRQVIEIGGTPGNPIGIEVDQRVFFYMPPNGRDLPEPEEGPVIEGNAEDAA
jgi:hypothetical protein